MAALNAAHSASVMAPASPGTAARNASKKAVRPPARFGFTRSFRCRTHAGSAGASGAFLKKSLTEEESLESKVFFGTRDPESCEPAKTRAWQLSK